MQAAKVRERFGISRLAAVVDQGMLTASRISEDFESAGLDWISALGNVDIRRLAKGGPTALDPAQLAADAVTEITSPDYPGERLMVCLNRGPKEEEQRRREEKIAAEAELDRVYVIRTSLDEGAIGAEDAVTAFNSLSHGCSGPFGMPCAVPGSVRSMHTPKTMRGRKCSSACWPSMWNGACDRSWRRCSSAITARARGPHRRHQRTHMKTFRRKASGHFLPIFPR